MLGAITKNGLDGIHAGFRITIEGFGDGVVRGQPLVTEGVVVSDERLHGQAGVLKKGRTADSAHRGSAPPGTLHCLNFTPCQIAVDQLAALGL